MTNRHVPHTLPLCAEGRGVALEKLLEALVQRLLCTRRYAVPDIPDVAEGHVDERDCARPQSQTI